MSIIQLTGLHPDLPIGAMAAYGVLRIVDSSRSVDSPKLGWSDGAEGRHAVLTTSCGLDRDDLVSLLIEDVEKAPNREVLKRSEQIKAVKTDEFAKTAAEFAGSATMEHRAAADWIASLASELVTDEDHVESTPFDMSVARQKFPADALRLAASLASPQRGRKQKTAVQEYKEALFGPWRYEDDQHSFGWDPSTIKLGAFTYKAPTGMANTGVRAAVWLAFESLPLFPVFAYKKQQRTRAFQQDGRQPVFRWPVWRTPISLSELKSLLASAALLGDDPQSWRELEARGVVAVYHSVKFKPNKYMVTFRPPELAHSAGRR